MRADAVAIGATHGGNAGRKVRLLSLDDLDGRTRARQRAEELRERLMVERGGPDRLDVMRTTHASTWAILSTMIEDQMARFLMGDPVEPAAVATLINARRREGEVLGEPAPRDVTPSIDRFVESIANAKAAAAPGVAAGESAGHGAAVTPANTQNESTGLPGRTAGKTQFHQS